jgi:hypothetical protein
MASISEMQSLPLQPIFVAGLMLMGFSPRSQQSRAPHEPSASQQLALRDELSELTNPGREMRQTPGASSLRCGDDGSRLASSELLSLSRYPLGPLLIAFSLPSPDSVQTSLTVASAQPSPTSASSVAALSVREGKGREDASPLTDWLQSLSGSSPHLASASEPRGERNH